MSDSVDRVFGHALNTINKIRHRSAKPPVDDQLALYGLYKQAMEGDASAIADRPAAKKEADKYDAWDANRGMSRTEAKKRYIEKLITTMHTYASGTSEARELVAELEFVWDQVKSNVMSDASSGESGASPGRRTDGMRVMSPVSQPVDPPEEDEGQEEFVDAPVSQFGEQPEDRSAGGDDAPVARTRRPSVIDFRWRRRIESALMKLTTEVAALREQVETSRTQKPRPSWLSWILSFGWFAIKLVVADVFVLWIIMWYLRRRKDRRLEGAIRVLLGDAQAVAKNLATQVQKTLPHRR